MTTRRLPLLLALLLAAGAARGAGTRPEPPILFRHISLEQGLSQASVQAVVQDEQGFLWIGTQDGLNRYDGYGFTVFRNDPLDPASIPDNGIACLAPGRGGALWIGTTDRGVARLDLSTLAFRRYPPEPGRSGGFPAATVTAILEDRAGRLWVGTGGSGLLRLGADGRSFEPVPLDPGASGGQPVRGISDLAEDPSGALWVGTFGRGVLKLHPADGRVLDAFEGDPATPGDRSLAFSADLLVDRAGRVWAGARSPVRIDPASRTVKVYPPGPAPSAFPARGLRGLAEDASGRIWFATIDGAVRLDPATSLFTTFGNRPDDASSLPSNLVANVFVDRSGLLWAGLDGSGLALGDLLGSPFRTYRYTPGHADGITAPIVRGVHEARDGTIWLGLAAGGLNAIDPATGRVRAFRAGPGPTGLSSDDVWSVTTDEDGIVWAGTLGFGLNRLDPRTGRVRVFRSSPGDAGLAPNRIRFVLTGRDGTIWIGTGGDGLWSFDRKAERFACFRNDPKDPGSLPHDVVRAVHEGPTGTIWVGTDGGIARLDTAAGRFTRFLDDPASPQTAGIARFYGLWESADGVVWAGTPRGVVRLDPATGAVTRFRQADGLPNDSVYSVLGDDGGSLWVSTNRGLTRLTPSADGRSATFRTFDARDGLQSDEFNGGAFHRGPAGTLWFGGIVGVTGVRPSEVKVDPFAPPVALLSFSRLGRKLPASDWLPSRSVVLGPNEGFFSVEFTALSFRAAAKNRYAWKLEGLQDEWVEAGTRRRADYTSVPPGSYLFRVKAANEDGVWNEEGASLRVVVRPPWWKTPAATSAWVLLLLGGGLVVFRAEKRRIVGKERERSQLVEAELRAQAAEAQARAVQAEADRKTAELEEARAMQLSLLPRETPRLPGLTVAAIARTATEVGGDTWDWAVGPDGALALVIGDATGHGVRAGTVVSVMKGLFRGDPAPADLGAFLDRGGRVLRDLGLARLHMALALLVVKDGRTTFASAGMPPAWVFRAATGAIDEVLVPGAPLGALVETPHASVSFRLDPGDAVLLSSDGLAESPGSGGEPLGYERARELFREAAPLPPEEALALLSLREEEWRGARPREDDLTLVLVRREG